MLGRSSVPHVPQSFTHSSRTSVLKATSSRDLIRKGSSIVTSAAGRTDGGGREGALPLPPSLHLRLIWGFLVLSSQQLVPAGTLGSKPALLLFLLLLFRGSSGSSPPRCGPSLVSSSDGDFGDVHHSCPPMMGTLGTSITGLNSCVYCSGDCGRESGAGRRTRSSCYQLDGRTGRDGGGRRAAEPGQTRLL